MGANVEDTVTSDVPSPLQTVNPSPGDLVTLTSHPRRFDAVIADKGALPKYHKA